MTSKPPAKAEKDKNQHIQVFVRCRPLNVSEKRQGAYNVVEFPGDRDINVRERTSPTAPMKGFGFDKVYGPHAKQIEIYKQVVAPVVDEVLLGYNCTVFAYGQTGTGKTFTMEGERTDDPALSWEEDPLAGIIPRAMHQLFSRLQRMGCEFSVRVSFLEIYNEELIDLLGAESVDNPRLKIYEDMARKGSCVIHGLEEVVVHNKNEVYQIMDRGSARRQTAATLMNAHSSRSHSLFMVTIHIKENSVDGEEMLKTGKLNLVDLAGSECIGRSGAIDKRAREAGNINQSLLTLGRVISALVEHAPHIPYRESKLTRLLQDSLGGRTKTSIIATVTPASSCLDETLSTLEYARRAKNITNRPEINQKFTKKVLLKEYTEEIERLRRDLQAARDKNGIFLAQENYDAMQTTIQQQRDSIIDFQDRISVALAEMMKLEDMFSQTKADLAETEAELTDTRTDLSNTRTTLEKTRHHLQATTQDRDEQQHLVRQQVQTEGKLTSQASQLLGTSNIATADVFGLHAKLDRKSAVEDHNSSAQDNFKADFRNNISDMQEKLKMFAQSQIQTTTSIHENVGSLVAKRSSELETMGGELSKLMGVLQTRVATISEEQQAHTAAGQEWATSVKDLCSHTLEGSVGRQNNFHEHTFLGSMIEIHSTLSHHNKALGELSTLLRTQMEEQNAKVGTFVASLQEELTVHSDLVTTFTGGMSECLEQQTQQMDQMLQAQEKLRKEQAEKFMVDVGKMVQGMMSTQDQQLTQLVNGVRDVSTDMSSRVSTYGSEATNQVESAVASCQQYKEDHHELTTGHNNKSQDFIHTQEAEVAGLLETHTRLKDNVSEFTSQTTELSTSRTVQLIDLLDQHVETLSLVQKGHDGNMQFMTRETQATVEGIKSTQTSQQEELVSEIKSEQARLRQENSDMCDWSAEVNEALEARHTDVNQLLTTEMKIDLPTGETPQRREFHYPKSLAKTDPHSMIIQDFRKEYVFRDISDRPIPDGSFTSLASEPPKLDLDDEEAEDDGPSHNTSRDSALSTTSNFSSVASECVLIEDVAKLTKSNDDGKEKSSEDSKENLMKPPPKKTVVKTRTRSRSKSGTRTPGTKRPGPNNTPGKITPSSQTRGRTKLPLRTNNPSAAT